LALFRVSPRGRFRRNFFHRSGGPVLRRRFICLARRFIGVPRLECFVFSAEAPRKSCSPALAHRFSAVREIRKKGGCQRGVGGGKTGFGVSIFGRVLTGTARFMFKTAGSGGGRGFFPPSPPCPGIHDGDRVCRRGEPGVSAFDPVRAVGEISVRTRFQKSEGVEWDLMKSLEKNAAFVRYLPRGGASIGRTKKKSSIFF